MEITYINGAGRRLPLPERPLEPKDCWGKRYRRPAARREKPKGGDAK